MISNNGMVVDWLCNEQRQAGRDRDRADDDWTQNPDMNSEDDPNEIVSIDRQNSIFSPILLFEFLLTQSGEYGHQVPSSPLSEKRGNS